MTETFSLAARTGIILICLAWTKREFPARFTRARAAAAYVSVFILWLGVEAIPFWKAGSLLLPLADAGCFLAAMELLTEREVLTEGKTLAEGKTLTEKKALPEERAGKRRMAAAFFVFRLSSEAVLGRFWEELLPFLTDSLIPAAVAAFCAAYVLLWYGAAGWMRRLRKERREEGRRLSEALSMQEELERQEERYREQEQAEEEIRALRHDMRNSYLLLHGLLEQNRKEEALAWLEKESGALSGVPEHIRTQSGAVSAVLNGKLNLARREGISVSCRIAASLAGIEERDLCRLLGNLLDNALEAARKTQNGTMDLVLCGGEGYLQIDLENASAKPLLLTDGRARTDKEDPKSHGRGLRIVRQIVEKYDGMMRVENREGSVTVRVVLFRKGKV